jgi:GNAT superfamily N-acetyltransferase
MTPIRDAQPEDREAMVAIDHMARGPFIDRALRSATCIVAEHDDRVLAYAVLEYTFFDNGFLSMVYMAESERRRGSGRALLDALAARCATRKLFTSTNQSNVPMQELLAALGYVRSGVIENLDPNDPELVYFLDLGERSGG